MSSNRSSNSIVRTCGIDRILNHFPLRCEGRGAVALEDRNMTGEMTTWGHSAPQQMRVPSPVLRVLQRRDRAYLQTRG